MDVLVTVASKHGATAEIGETIAKELTDQGCAVTLADPADVTDVSAFDAVVLGSAVYAGRWLAEARQLTERCGDQLRDRPVWLLSSGPVGDPPKPEEEAVDVAEVVAATGAREHRVFAGRIDKGRLGFAERAIVRALKVPEGDFRDRDAIVDWARQIAVALDDARSRHPDGD